MVSCSEQWLADWCNFSMPAATPVLCLDIPLLCAMDTAQPLYYLRVPSLVSCCLGALLTANAALYEQTVVIPGNTAAMMSSQVTQLP